MAPVKCPDFIVHCYSDADSLKSKDNLLDIFFLSVKVRESIDGGLLKGGAEKLKVDIGTVANTFEGEITLSDTSFTFRKIVNFKGGGGYILELNGTKPQGYKYYSGTFKAIDKSTNKVNPYYSGSFQVSAGHFFEKYLSN